MCFISKKKATTTLKGFHPNSEKSIMRKKELIFDEKSKSNFAKGTKKSGDGPGDDGELESAVMYKIHCAVYVVQCTSCLVVEYQTY